MDVPIISALTAKVLMLVEGGLNYFVTVTPAGGTDQCSESLTLNAALTDCGEELVTTLAIHEWTEALAEIMHITGLSTVTSIP